MEILVFVGIILVFMFINKMALRTAINSQNEEITREINRKLIQNKKLDELYGRNSGNAVNQLERAVKDVAEAKAKNSASYHE